MVLDLTVYARDRDNLIADAPSTLTYNNTSYTCRKTMLQKELKYGDFGASEGYTFSVRVTKTTSDAIPERAKVTIGSKGYRVISRDTDRFDLSVLIHLGDQYA